MKFMRDVRAVAGGRNTVRNIPREFVAVEGGATFTDFYISFESLIRFRNFQGAPTVLRWNSIQKNTDASIFRDASLRYCDTECTGSITGLFACV